MREKLKKRREYLKISKQMIANETGITIRYYDMIENGERDPRLPIIKKLMKIFKTDSISIFDKENEDTNDEKIKLNKGDVSKEICKYMNAMSSNKKYNLFCVGLCRKLILLEKKDRDENNIKINGYTEEGKNEIYKRIDTIAIKNGITYINSKDVQLYRRCSRYEFENRTGKCSWGLKDERKKKGYDPVTNLEVANY